MYPLEDVQLQDLGQVSEVTITKDDTLLMKVKLLQQIRLTTMRFVSNFEMCYSLDVVYMVAWREIS